MNIDLPATLLTPVRAKVAERAFRHIVRDLPIRVEFPDRPALGPAAPNVPVLRIDRPTDFFARIGSDTKIGFGESYMAGDWSSSDLVAVLTPIADRAAGLVPQFLQVLRPLVEHRKPGSELNTIDGARHNVHRHYDLSNELFATFLDPSMTYSSAWFAPGSDDLEFAQRRKHDAVLDAAAVESGCTVLEIGTGWGSLAIRAAERGAEVTTVTISPAQQELARKRISAAGFEDRIEVLLRDYREIEGRYDAVVSVEMVEAVGERYWPEYFHAIDRALAPRGRVGLQAITMPHERMVATRNSYTWIHKYIFPGGHLLSVPAIEHTVARHTDLQITARRSLGPDYARTLSHWRGNFRDNAAEVERLGFDETFRRMWDFYLAYCEAGFRARYLDVWQLALSR